MKHPSTKKFLTIKKFGNIEGQYRGIDKNKLINPPIELNDNYDWLRDDTRTNKDILDHITNENSYTDYILENHDKLQKNIYDEVKSYVRDSYDSYAYYLNDQEPWKYFRRYLEGKDYPSYYRKTDDFIEELLLDVNELAKGKSQCDIKSFLISPNHEFISYGVDYNGSEKYELVIEEIKTKNKIKNVIPKLTYCSYFWTDSNLIYYLVGDDANRLCELWLYDINKNSNILVYKEENLDFDINADLTNDKKYVIISTGNYDSYHSKIIEWQVDPTIFVDFLPIMPKVKYSIEHHENYWYVHTNWNAINWQILKINDNSEIDWDNLIEFIPANPDIYISSFIPFEKFLTFKTKINGNTYLNLIDPEKTYIKIITHLDNKMMTWDGYINQDFTNLRSDNVYTICYGYNNEYTTENLNIIFSSMISPTKLFDYNIYTLENIQVYEQVVPNYNESLYSSKRIWIEQEETKLGIPVSIVYRTDLYKEDGTNPLFLYGYGSYGHTVNPDFDYRILPLLDRGYIYVIAHVRGGSFLGYDWYMQGKMETKMNSFKDFIRCAEYFKESSLCDPKKIVIEGRSAGGLLIGASVSLRPDLFWIAIPGVPFVDVLNTMSDSTIPLTTEEWTQWGNPNEQESFDLISQYCPYTNIKQAYYPHIYCTAGLHDPRVPYWEALKFISKIRELKMDENIQVIRVETEQGHFGGSSRYKSIEQLAEKYAFIFTR